MAFANIETININKVKFRDVTQKVMIYVLRVIFGATQIALSLKKGILLGFIYKNSQTLLLNLKRLCVSGGTQIGYQLHL